ncbi:TadE family protein [Vibrio olivae]
MKKRNKSHHGLSIIEFTFVVTALFLIMFWVMEAGRYMYSLQLINNATRVSARLAVVCRVQDQADIPLLAVPKPLLGGFSANDIDIEYLDSNGSKLILMCHLKVQKWKPILRLIMYEPKLMKVSNINFLAYLVSLELRGP